MKEERDSHGFFSKFKTARTLTEERDSPMIHYNGKEHSDADVDILNIFSPQSD
jgi:hypothetical protein